MLHKIRELCEARGITIAELERQAGLTPTSMAKWNANMPAVDKVAKVAKVLGVTIEELLEDDPADETCRKLDETSRNFEKPEQEAV